MILRFWCLCLSIFVVATSSLWSQEFERPIKINGISIWSDSTERYRDDFSFVETSNANWVSFHPFGVVRDDSTGVEYDLDKLWECSSFEGLKINIAIAKEMNYDVFIKPHLVLDYEKSGSWVGNMKLSSAGKEAFKTTYLSYMVELAQISENMGVGMLSLGTELNKFSAEDSVYWSELIDTVRNTYSGKLTYCANFDAYETYSFWNRMDLISIDAYFSVTRDKNADLDACREGWKDIVDNLEAFSLKYDRKILFAEYGYMSVDHCAFRPFEQQSGNVNLVAQANAYRALFDSFWYKNWFAGGFSWVWHFDQTSPFKYDNPHYSPQNKPAQEIIAWYYGVYR